MEPLRAEETLRERGHEYNPRGVRALTLLATDDPKAADAAQVRAMEREADRRCGT
jgi:hypothetical protein